MPTSDPFIAPCHQPPPRSEMTSRPASRRRETKRAPGGNEAGARRRRRTREIGCEFPIAFARRESATRHDAPRVDEPRANARRRSRWHRREREPRNKHPLSVRPSARLDNIAAPQREVALVARVGLVVEQRARPAGRARRRGGRRCAAAAALAGRRRRRRLVLLLAPGLASLRKPRLQVTREHRRAVPAAHFDVNGPAALRVSGRDGTARRRWRWRLVERRRHVVVKLSGGRRAQPTGEARERMKCRGGGVGVARRGGAKRAWLSRRLYDEVTKDGATARFGFGTRVVVCP